MINIRFLTMAETEPQRGTKISEALLFLLCFLVARFTSGES